MPEPDNLHGFGKPLRGIDDVNDENWWIREKLRREEVDLELPPALEIRQAKRDLLVSLSAFADETVLRRQVEELNTRIAHVNRVAATGPPSTTTMIDVDLLVAEWRTAKH